MSIIFAFVPLKIARRLQPLLESPRPMWTPVCEIFSDNSVAENPSIFSQQFNFSAVGKSGIQAPPEILQLVEFKMQNQSHIYVNK